MDTKQILIDEFFTIKDGRGTEVDSFIIKLKLYTAANEHDREMKHMLARMQAVKESYNSSNFELCRDITSGIFDELLEDSTLHLSFVEVIILARVIEFAPTIKIAKHVAQKTIDLLEAEYINEKKCKTAKWMVSFNIIPRLIQAKYPNSESLKEEIDPIEIQSLFKHHMEIARHISDKNNLLPHIALLKMREGVFFANSELIDEGLTWLMKHERKNWYPSARDELMAYYIHLRGDITKNQLDILIGYRINEKRESLNIPIEYAAEFIGLSESGLNQIETGRRGAKSIHLYKLAQLFGVDVSFFFYGEVKTPLSCGDDEKLELLLQEIKLNMQGTTDELKKQISIIVKALAKT